MSYVIEVFIITLYTQIVPIAIASMVCKFLSGVSAFEILNLCPWYYIIVLICGILTINIFVSVLSIMGIIKRPPAQLAAKN